METGVRKNTMKLCFEAGTRNPAHLEVLKFIVDSLKLSAADLHSVYKDENDGNFYLKFMDEVIFARFVNELDEHYRFRHNDGAESFVQLVPASRIFRYVRIFNLPPEIEDQAIASALRQYGTIRQHVRERYPLDYKFSVFSGVRGVHMEVSKEIPANLFVGHFRARIYYDGLKNRCFHCKEEGHLKSSCPKLATGSSGSGGSRTYSSVTARGTPAPSPVLLVPEFRPEMQVLNKKQATDSNNVKETVEAEATITDPVVVPAAIPVAPPLTSPVAPPLASPVAPPPGCPVAPPTAIPAALPPASPAKDDVPAGPSKSPAEIMAVLQRMAQEAEESMDTSNPKLAVKRSANSSTDGEENGGEDGFKPVIPKGEGCVEKPLATLWRNYTQNSKPDVMMKLCLCPSGLKATTRQHGLTEYWSHRITYCTAPKNYPRVFCWIYRHEGRKLKHEFRCHAVICTKESVAQDISTVLKENLTKALQEFKRDKLNRQNARLSLANSVYDNPSMPRRKIMLSVGSNNYRPPLERSKSAPKLMAIEEMIGEEEEDDERPAVTVAPSRVAKTEEFRACCREDALFPSTTLGRRRCRRGHSIRRGRLRNSFKSPKAVEAKVPLKNENVVQDSPMTKSVDSILDTIKQEEEDEGEVVGEGEGDGKVGRHSDSSEDDFEAFLLNYNYNSKEPLSTELISYLDTKLSPKVVASMHDLSNSQRSEEGEPSRRLEPSRYALSLDDLDNYEEDEHDHEDTEDEVFFNQDEVLEMLRSAAESANNFIAGEKSDLMSLLQEAPSGEDDTAPPSLLCVTNKINGNSDSDEGSISSGCETSSTVTTNTDESAAVLIKPCSVLERVRSFEQLAEHQVIHEPLGEKTPLGSKLNSEQLFKRSITFPAPGVKTSFLLPVTTSTIVHHEAESPNSTRPNSSNSGGGPSSRRLKSTVAAINTELINHLQAIDSDSDLSDESGYVEFQEHHGAATAKSVKA